MSTYNVMYQDTLMGLMNGCLMPWDKELLSCSPLPADVIEPYMTKEVPDVRESMRLTYETMVVWIDEAKKANYFSKRFVQLSKMIMNGVTTMGRGLITLHARGEELEGVPMSIQDLIGVASYHFRKSHLGCLQTVRTHPEISERLLMNQIGWNNMLMRLFKTKEKLSENTKSEIRNKQLASNEEGRIKNKELASGSMLLSNPDAGNQLSAEGLSLPGTVPGEFGPAERGISEPASIKEPGAFTAPRAFSSFEKKKSETLGNEKTDENEKGRMKNKENEAKNKKLENRTEDEVPPTLLMQMKSSPEADGPNDMSPDIPDAEKPNEISPEKLEPGEPTYPPSEPEAGPENQPIHDDSIPGYLKILQNVFARNEPDEEGKLTFTIDEMVSLVSDPYFNEIYPDQAAQMRSILQQINSS